MTELRAWSPTGYSEAATGGLHAVRCSRILRNGERCKRRPIIGATVCLGHGANLAQVRANAAAQIEAARLRLLEDSGLAIDTLENLLEAGTADAIRLKAATEILDRVGIRGGVDYTVTVENVDSASSRIAERLERLKTTHEKRAELRDAAVDHEPLDVEWEVTSSDPSDR